jgi:hypothetical protein
MVKPEPNSIPQKSQQPWEAQRSQVLPHMGLRAGARVGGDAVPLVRPLENHLSWADGKGLPREYTTHVCTRDEKERV